MIPAFDPDYELLSSYVQDLQAGVADVVHVELDAPDGPPAGALETPDSHTIVRRRRGKGQAITDGFDSLETDVLAFADADGATPSSSIDAVVAPVRDGAVELSIGSRRHPASTIESHQTRFRRRLGDSFAWLARQLLPISVYDYQCGAKALTADAWEQIRPSITETGFAWDLELLGLAGQLGISHREVPVRWNDQPGSTVDPLGATYEMGTALFAIRRRLNTIEPSVADDEPIESNVSPTDSTGGD